MKNGINFYKEEEGEKKLILLRKTHHNNNKNNNNDNTCLNYVKCYSCDLNYILIDVFLSGVLLCKCGSSPFATIASATVSDSGNNGKTIKQIFLI